MRFGTSKPTAGKGLGAGLALAAYGALWVGAQLWRWPVPAGRDGYYYVVQVTSLAAHGAGYYPTAFPGALYWLALPTWFGMDDVNAVKLGVVAAQAVFILGVWTSVRLATPKFGQAVATTLLACHLPLATYLHSEFLANFVAVALFTVLIAALCAIESGASRRQWTFLVAAASAIVVSLSHRSGGPVVALLGGCAMVAVRLLRPADVPERLRTLTVLVGTTALGALLLTMLLVRFGSGPHNGWADSWRIMPALRPTGGIFSAHWFVIMSALATLAGLTLTHDAPSDVSRRLGIKAPLACWSVVLAGVLLAANPWGVYTAGMTSAVDRLALWSVALVPMCCAVVITLLSAAYGRVLAWLVFGALAGAILTVKPEVPGQSVSFMSEREHLASVLPILGRELGGQDCVIAEHGIQFMVTAFLGVPSASSRSTLSPTCHPVWLLRDPAPGSNLGTISRLVVGGWCLVEDERFFAWLRQGPVTARLAAVSSRNSLLLVRDQRVARLALEAGASHP